MDWPCELASDLVSRAPFVEVAFCPASRTSVLCPRVVPNVANAATGLFVFKYSQVGRIKAAAQRSTCNNNKLEIAFFDNGKPVEKEKIKHRAIDDIKPGGLGTFFIQEIMDSIVFKEGNKPWINNLVLTKKL